MQQQDDKMRDFLIRMSTTNLVASLQQVKELNDQELINMFSYELALRFYKYDSISKEISFMDLLTSFGYVNPLQEKEKPEDKKKGFFRKK